MKIVSRLKDVPLCTAEDPRLPRPTLRHILIASGELSPQDKDDSTQPTMQLIDVAFEQTDAEALQATDLMLRDCLDNVSALDQLLMGYVGASVAPNFGRLEQVLRQMQSKTAMYLERRGYGEDVSLFKQIKSKVGNILDKKQSGSEENSSGSPAFQGIGGTISTKADVLKALDMIVAYYEQNEPSSPVPLIIKRAKRLVGRSFVDIIRDISPDALSQVRMVSGEEDDISEE